MTYYQLNTLFPFVCPNAINTMLPMNFIFIELQIKYIFNQGRNIESNSPWADTWKVVRAQVTGRQIRQSKTMIRPVTTEKDHVSSTTELGGKASESKCAPPEGFICSPLLNTSKPFTLMALISIHFFTPRPRLRKRPLSLTKIGLSSSSEKI